MAFKKGFIAFKVDIFLMRFYIVVTDIVNDVTYSHKSSYACGRNTFYFLPYSENQCISKLDKIGIFIDMKFLCYQIPLISKVTSD